MAKVSFKGRAAVAKSLSPNGKGIGGLKGAMTLARKTTAGVRLSPLIRNQFMRKNIS